MYARQHDLLGIAIQCGLHICKHILEWARPARPARHSGDAKSAVVVTAVLHLDKGTRALTQPGQWLAGNRFEVEGFSWQIQDFRNKGLFVCVIDYAQNIW